jgi:hypothetical protein
LARPPSTLHLPLHTDFGLLAERGRDLLSALTRRRLKRGSFHSIVDLQVAINRYIDEHNDEPKPFTWTQTPTQILAKLNPLNAPLH